MNKNFKDLTGQRFSMLVLISASSIKDKNGRKRTWWLCKCDCGNEISTRVSGLKSGRTKSCGCYNKEIHFKHGHTTTKNISPEWESWRACRARCYRKTNASYHNYGARGITVCDRWLNSFNNFLTDMGPRPDGTTLDRINTYGNYEPSNCRWATQEQQSNNTRSSHYVTYRGETKTATQWSKLLGISWNKATKLKD